MRKVEEKQVGARRYRMTQLGAETADTVLARIFLGLGNGKLTVAEVISAKKELVSVTEVAIPDPLNPGRPPTWMALATQYDEMLAGEVGHRMELLLALWEHSFGPLSAVQKELEGFWTALSRSISPATPGGSSTVSSSPTA